MKIKYTKTRILAGIIAMITAATPVISYAADIGTEHKDTNLLILNLKSKGGTVVINDGEETEQSVKLDSYDDKLCVDVYDKDDVLISSEDAEENHYSYVFEAEADTVVTLDAKSDDGFEITSVEEDGEPESDFEKSAGTFSLPVFMDGDKTVSFEFKEKPADTENPEDIPEDGTEESEVVPGEEPETAPGEESEEVTEGTPVPESEPEESDDIIINPNEESDAEDVEVNSEAEEIPEEGPTLPEDGNTDEMADPEPGVNPDSETDETNETEHFLESTASIEGLNVSDFSSSRLVVLADNQEDILDPEHLIGTYGNLYLLQYQSPEQAMNAYAYYQVHADAVEPDMTMTAASEQNVTELPAESGTNPIRALAEEGESATAQFADKVIALIDTGVQEGPNVVDRISLIDEVLTGNGHGDQMVRAITSQNPDARILSIRAMGDDGRGTVSSIVAGMEYAMDQNVDVINLSLYSKTNLANTVIDSEIQKAVSLGIEVVGAAGNDNADVKDYMPGSVDHAWIIGACDADGQKIDTSNYGRTVDFNVVADSTSEAAAKFSGYLAKNGADNVEINNGLIYGTDYIPSEPLPEPSPEPDVGDDDMDIDINEPDVDMNAEHEQVEGYPGANSTTVMEETVWTKDVWYDFKTYNPYGDAVTAECVTDIGDVSYKAGDSFEAEYDYTLKSRPDYHFTLSVIFTFTEDREATTLCSDKAMSLLPPFVNQDRNEGYTGKVPEHTGETVDGGIYTALLGNEDFSLEGLLLPYNPNTFKVNNITDDGGFDINKPGRYTVTYEMSYFMYFDYTWFVQVQVDVVDPASLEPGVYITSRESTLFMTRKEDGLYGGYGNLFRLEKDKTDFIISCIDEDYEVGVISSNEALDPDSICKVSDNGNNTKLLTVTLPETLPDGATILSIERPGYVSTKAFMGGGWQDQEYTEGQLAVLSEENFEEFEDAVSGESKEDPEEYMQTAAGWSTVKKTTVDGTLVSGKANVTNFGWQSTFPGSNYGTVQASKSASKIANVVSTAGYNVNPADIKDFSFACASGHNYLALPANSTYKCKITVEVQKNGSDFRVRLSCWFDKPSDGQGNYQSFYGSTYVNRVTKGIEFRIFKRMAGKGFHASTDRVGDLSTSFSIYTDAQCKNLEATVRVKVDKEDANNDYVSAYASVTLDPGRYWVKETYRIVGTQENTDIYPIRITESTKSPAKLKDVLVGDPNDFPSLTNKDNNHYIYNQPWRYYGELFRKLCGTDKDNATPVEGAVFRVEYSSEQEDTADNKDAFKTAGTHYTWYFKTDAQGKVIYDEAHLLKTWTHPDTGKVYKSDPLIYFYEDPALPQGFLRATEMWAPPQYVMNKNTLYFKVMGLKNSQGVYSLRYCKIAYSELINGTWEVNWAQKGAQSWTEVKTDADHGEPGVNRGAIFNTIKNIKVGVKKTSSAPEDVMNLEGYSLEGAEFEIWTDKTGGSQVTMYKDEASKKPVTRLVTDKDGNTPEYYIPVKSNATYWVREVKAPAGHKIAEPQPLKITLPEDAGKLKEVAFEDAPEWTDVPDAAVEKLNSKGQPIGGVVFKVQMYDGKYDTPEACPANKLEKTWYLKSDRDGKVQFDRSHLADFEYPEYSSDPFYLNADKKPVIPVNATLTMQEIKAPADCEIDDTVMLWDTSGKVIQIKRHYNKPSPASIRIKKKDADGQTPLANVTFELTFKKQSEEFTPNADPDYKPLLKEGESIQATTDSNGEIHWENLDHGTYIISEVETVPGHTLLPEPIEVVLPLTMTDEEVKENNVDTSKGQHDEGYTGDWYFFDVTYEVTNSAQFVMPTTGASGFWKYGLIGMGTMAAIVAGVIMYDTQTKNRRRHKKYKK